MKKYLLILLTLTVGTLVSCNKNNGDNNGGSNAKSEYAFYEPVLKWNAGKSEIRSEMSKMADWFEETELADEKTIQYSNKNNQAVSISYKFESEKMIQCSITYLSCNDMFDQMKDDWAKALNLTWKQSAMGANAYEAKCKSKECRLIANLGTFYMTITIQYEDLFFE